MLVLADEVGDIGIFVAGGIAMHHFQGEVGTVERTDKYTIVIGDTQVKLLDDVMSGHLVGGGCECHDGDIWKIFMYHSQLGIFGPEIMSPVTDAVGFVDGE